MTPMAIQIFLPCFFGSRLAAVASDLSYSLFHSEWHQQSLVYQKAFMTFIGHINNPACDVRAVGIFNVNLETFVTICNGAYSLFAFFKNVNA